MRAREKGNLRLEDVPIPEWDQAGEPPAVVMVRNIRGGDRDSFETEAYKAGDTQASVRARLFVRVVCDEKGERLYKDSDWGEVSRWDAKVLDRVWDVGRRLGKFSDKDVAEIEKNSASSRNGDSGSGSVSPTESPSGSSNPESTGTSSPN